MRRLAATLVAAATLVTTLMATLMAGCGAPSTDSPPASEAPTSDAMFPSLPQPSGVPSDPSDPHQRDILAGSITGGSGSCYTLIDDDSHSYALVGVARTLSAGQVVRVQIDPAQTPPAPPADCAGTPVTVLKVEVVG